MFEQLQSPKTLLPTTISHPKLTLSGPSNWWVVFRFLFDQQIERALNGEPIDRIRVVRSFGANHQALRTGHVLFKRMEWLLRLAID